MFQIFSYVNTFFNQFRWCFLTFIFFFMLSKILSILVIFREYWYTRILSCLLGIGCTWWRAWPAFWFLAILNRKIKIIIETRFRMVSRMITTRIFMYQLFHTCSDSDKRGASDIEAIDFDLPSFWSAQSGLSWEDLNIFFVHIIRMN